MNTRQLTFAFTGTWASTTPYAPATFPPVCTASSVPFLTTLSARTTMCIDESIEQVIRMPLWTVRNSCSFRRRALAPKGIISRRHWFHMSRVYTQPISAKMVNGKSCWNRADEEFIGEAMGKHHTRRQPKQTIPCTLLSAHPLPTSLCLLYLGPKAHVNWPWLTILVWHKKAVPSPAYAPLSHDAQAGERRRCPHCSLARGENQ